MQSKKCPLCNQTVSQTLYEKITGIWKARRAQEQALKEEKDRLLKQQKAARAELLQEKATLKAQQKKIIQAQAREQERRFASQIEKVQKQKAAIIEQANRKILLAAKHSEQRVRRELKGEMRASLNKSVQEAVSRATAKTQKENIKITRTLASTTQQMSALQTQNQKQQDRIKNLEIQLKSKTTPQLEGLLYETELLKALGKEFPKDKLFHTGKGGDILQEIVVNGKVAGRIIYECKRVLNWNGSHVEQAAQAKIQRKAEYAVLVTNATKKGTGGFFVEKGVIVVHPAGVLAIANILHDQIVAIARLALSKSQKEEAAENTLRYLEGAEFKNSIDLIIRKTYESYEDLKKECKEHFHSWEKRHNTLKSVYIGAAQIQGRTTALISGKNSATLEMESVRPFPALELESLAKK